MWLEDHFGSGSMLQRNERVKLAASFWNNIGAGMVIGGMAAAFFLDKPQGTWTKIGIAIAGLLLGWLCYSIASNMLTYLHTAPEVLAEDAAKEVYGLHRMFRRFSSAVATSREGHRSPRSGRAAQHQLWGRAQLIPSQPRWRKNQPQTIGRS
jgi:hypothetical protein